MRLERFVLDSLVDIALRVCVHKFVFFSKIMDPKETLNVRLHIGSHFVRHGPIWIMWGR
jgi:hypothetical protein